MGTHAHHTLAIPWIPICGTGCLPSWWDVYVHARWTFCGWVTEGWEQEQNCNAEGGGVVVGRLDLLFVGFAWCDTHEPSSKAAYSNASHCECGKTASIRRLAVKNTKHSKTCWAKIGVINNDIQQTWKKEVSGKTSFFKFDKKCQGARPVHRKEHGQKHTGRSPST